MKALMKKHLKNQKGLTLIELLAVVVILGIIAAIAVPSIGAIMDNTRKDAHIANAEQLVNAAQIAKATNVGDGRSYNLSDLIHADFIENPDVPGNKGKYDGEKTKVSYDSKTKEYRVTLHAGKEILHATTTELRADNRRSKVSLP